MLLTLVGPVWPASRSFVVSAAKAELWRTAFAGLEQMRYLALLALGLACQPQLRRQPGEGWRKNEAKGKHRGPPTFGLTPNYGGQPSPGLEQMRYLALLALGLACQP